MKQQKLLVKAVGTAKDHGMCHFEMEIQLEKIKQTIHKHPDTEVKKSSNIWAVVERFFLSEFLLFFNGKTRELMMVVIIETEEKNCVWDWNIKYEYNKYQGFDYLIYAWSLFCFLGWNRQGQTVARGPDAARWAL